MKTIHLRFRVHWQPALIFVLAGLFGAYLSGCERSPHPVKDSATNTKNAAPAKETGKMPSGPQGTEAEARAAVKAALDGWAFGDSEAQFEKAHPGIKLLDYSRITKKLARHEIGAARRDGNSFEFLVTLTFQEESGEVTRSGTYTVVKNAEGEWEIFGGAN